MKERDCFASAGRTVGQNLLSLSLGFGTLEVGGPECFSRRTSSSARWHDCGRMSRPDADIGLSAAKVAAIVWFLSHVLSTNTLWIATVYVAFPTLAPSQIRSSRF